MGFFEYKVYYVPTKILLFYFVLRKSLGIMVLNSFSDILMQLTLKNVPFDI